MSRPYRPINRFQQCDKKILPVALAQKIRLNAKRQSNRVYDSVNPTEAIELALAKGQRCVM
ncbi:hypothetical protein X744_21065 [Mesorhizobium sp. LNJC372A00]|nr:hypothetical protein X745_23915 [Mesorhizobium sp. LNJC374B00]ESY56842.1 hypothetical protein X744_21065 [Mesorhizobium sp. LNJC372A00]ESZ43647.1 hypothetical protein X730_27685 [Mesorhizobium sp. L103C565B0]